LTPMLLAYGRIPSNNPGIGNSPTDHPQSGLICIQEPREASLYQQSIRTSYV
jgi:hypothetical protein